MPEFLFQYRREQRVNFTVEAETSEKAEALALGREFKLGSADDESDDPGEFEMLEEVEPLIGVMKLAGSGPNGPLVGMQIDPAKGPFATMPDGLIVHRRAAKAGGGS